MTIGGGAFSPEERVYLESLPAVRRVTQTRIMYEKTFKLECLRLYYSGVRPIELFRAAGLDPDLIGYKRIERCMARWKLSYGKPEGWPVDGDDESDECIMRGFDRIASKHDYRDILIGRQIRRINHLENRVKELEAQISAYENVAGKAS